MAQRDLSKKEKLLLQLIGENPYLTNEELSEIIGYKYAEYVSTLQKKLRNRGYFYGPLMFPDFGKIFKNKVSRVYAFIMFNRTYEYIRWLLKEIDCWIYFYPVEEGIFRKDVVCFINSDIHKLKKIFDYLKDSGIIQYYHLFKQEGRWEIINPTFLIGEKDAPIDPDFDHLMDDIPDPGLTYSSFANISLNEAAQLLLIYFWNGRQECDLKKIIREEKRYREEREAAHMETLELKKEKRGQKPAKSELKELKGDLLLNEFREAYNLLVDHDVLEKIYYVFPFSPSRCSRFWLLLRCNSVEATKRVVFNFGKNVRIFSRVAMVQSVETGAYYGSIFAQGDPFLVEKLMIALDRYPEIEDRKLFPTRSFPSSQWETQGIPLEGYYNPKTQTLDYPYDLFYKRVKRKVEEK